MHIGKVGSPRSKRATSLLQLMIVPDMASVATSRKVGTFSTATVSTRDGPGRHQRKQRGTNASRSGRSASCRPLTVRLHLPGLRHPRTSYVKYSMLRQSQIASSEVGTIDGLT